MCNYRTLVYNKSGYIIKCNSCAHLQVAFGTTITSLSVEEFDVVADELSQQFLYRNPCADPEMKRSQVRIDDHTMFCLNFIELEALNDMFQQAKALLETYSILENC